MFIEAVALLLLIQRGKCVKGKPEKWYATAGGTQNGQHNTTNPLRLFAVSAML